MNMNLRNIWDTEMHVEFILGHHMNHIYKLSHQPLTPVKIATS